VIFMNKENIGLRWESGDRIPDDLTVGPIQVDTLAVLLFGVMAGLLVFNYSPRVGELRMSGHLGAVSSAVHPMLGSLLHYTPTALRSSGQDPMKWLDASKVEALRHRRGVWVNAVFGRFRNRRRRGSRYEMLE
jgi:hypothetical protein